MLRHRDETKTAKRFVSANDTYNIPIISITYTVNPIGTEDFWTYAGGVNVFNGNLVLGATDTGMPGRGSIGFSRSYNSRSGINGVLGYGWTANVFSYIKPNAYGPVVLVDDDGTEHIFYRNTDGTYASPPGVFLELVKNGDNTYTVSHMNGTKVYFNANGKITSMVDINGNTTTFEYNATTGKLENVKDSVYRATLPLLMMLTAGCRP